MPGPQMDALGAFSYLAHNVPSWLSRLSELTDYTVAKNVEFAEAFKEYANSSTRVRRRRNSSVYSIQTNSPNNGGQAAIPRKRGADEGDVSSIASGEGLSVISTRHNLIIHYDGYTQTSLDEMVRNIGTARNNLRKGKMSQLPLGGLRAGRMKMSSRPQLPSFGSPDDLLSTMRSARSPGPQPPQVHSPAKESPFEIAEKQLELAHGLCETAAYNFLRAGDCLCELKRVKDQFTALVDLATAEVKQLEEERKSLADEEEAANTTHAETARLKRPASNEGPIEVDDEQVSVESIDLATFRVSRMRR
ncbi:hypothetical protein P175DRAFT_0554603 [Aspergillus ochraceoroseus IBT 24754]|uniref:Uncharacterized protein n=2 Tax=Aspergillus ochraceoroseus TaxID=138278 RepID=A0A2T5MA25_9EURO|nr:uncharacterized protein P175DRAFT_0554603 [Aspergillus ochraceoroseus IBT 24754]KKK17040.1 hypothetical protein AOCH_004420 [Aspergillus ochraceoroseus]PTU25355.1 hypothetical protein P175DRAFT_0554603 [Aspergillus ochraceoroseus IBT 24754]